MASAGKKSNSRSRSASKNASSAAKPPHERLAANDRAPAAQHFVVCVRNDDYPASLELRKLYPALRDAFGAEHGMTRVIDESGEDYLYPDSYFVRVELPKAIERVLRKIA